MPCRVLLNCLVSYMEYYFCSQLWVMFSLSRKFGEGQSTSIICKCTLSALSHTPTFLKLLVPLVPGFCSLNWLAPHCCTLQSIVAAFFFSISKLMTTHPLHFQPTQCCYYLSSSVTSFLYSLENFLSCHFSWRIGRE